MDKKQLNIDVSLKNKIIEQRLCYLKKELNYSSKGPAYYILMDVLKNMEVK